MSDSRQQMGSQMNASDTNRVPSGWQVLRLEDVARERIQRAISAQRTEVFSVTKHAGFVRSLEYFDRQVFSRDTSNYKVVRRGDLAYATIHLDEGSLGILRDADNGIISPMYTVFEVDRAWAQPEFLFSLMKLPQMVARYQRIGEGTVHRRRSISFKRLARLSFAFPPMPEQRAIGAVLDSIDKAIERTEEVVAATERLREAIFHELFTLGVPGWHTEWKEVPGMGTIPADWKVVRIEDVAEVNPRRPKLHVEAHTPLTFIPMAGIGENCAGITSRAQREYREISSGYTYFEEKDVLFAKITPCLQNGKHAIATGLSTGFGFGTTEFHVVRAGPSIVPRFLFRVLTQPRNIEKCTRNFSGTAGQQRVQPETLKSLNLPLPSVSEQYAIVTTLDKMDDAIKRARAVKCVLQPLRDSTADALLTGRVRVPHAVT